MSTLFILFIFALAAYLTWTRGLAVAFALVYLPVLVLVSAARPVVLPLLPDLTSTFAVGYGVLAGIALRGGFGGAWPFRWNLLDSIVTGLWLLAAIAVGNSEGVEMARNVLGDGFFDFLTPYLLARAAFHAPEGRRLALWSLVACALLVALMSPIEMRLRPQLFSRLLDAAGLYIAPNSMPLYRLGLARAQTTFLQPMDQGNGGLLLAALIGVFAATTRYGLRDWRVAMGLGAAVFVGVASLSFSAFLNIAIAGAVFGVLWSMKWTGRLLPVAAVIAVVGGVMVTNTLLTTPLGERSEKFGQDVRDSLHMRTLIVQQSWPLVQEAGLWGYGKRISKDRLDLDSVDNAYLLFIMQRGWPYFLLFLTIPFVVTFRAARAWGDFQTDAQRLPVAIAVAGLLAILVAMYTIFFGFVYAKLWLVLLGTFNSTVDALRGSVPAAQRAAYRPPGMAPGVRGTAYPVVAGKGA